MLPFTGIDGMEGTIAFIKDWQTVILAVTFTMIYAVGVILDRIADHLFNGHEKKIEGKILRNKGMNIAVMRYSLGTQNDFLNQQLEYTRSRMRIARASIINFPLIGVSAGAFFYFGYASWGAKTMILMIIAGLLLGLVSFYAWKSLKESHLELAQTMYEHLTKKNFSTVQIRAKL